MVRGALVLVLAAALAGLIVYRPPLGVLLVVPLAMLCESTPRRG